MNRISPSALLALASIVLTFLLIVYGADGVRGSDQYWYIADVQTIAAGLPPVSNTWFPTGLLRAGSDDYPNYIFHNGPLLHLVAALGKVLPASPYSLWMGINLLSLLITIAVVGLWLRSRANATVANYAMALCALSPIGLWQSANILRETWFGALAALSFVLFFHSERRPLAQLPLTAILAVGAFAHPMYLILMVLLLLWQLYGVISKRSALIGLMLVLNLVAIVLIRSSTKSLFPSSFQPDLASIIASAVPNLTNMMWHFADVQVPVDASLLWDKFVHALKKQFATPGQMPVYFLSNAGLVAWAYLWFKRPSGLVKTLVVITLFFGLYGSMVVLQQNHPRFQQLIAAMTFIAIGHAFFTAGFKNKTLAILCVPVLLGCLAVNVYSMNRLRGETQDERVSVSQIRSALLNQDQLYDPTAIDAVMPEEMAKRFLFIDIRQHDPMSWALRPHKALFVRSKLISEAAAQQAIALFAPKTVVTRPMDELPFGLSGYAQSGTINTPSFGEMVVWDLPPAE